VLTLCRGRSHDDFYFRHPERITGDKPPVPFLSMGRPEIVRRLAAKECLRRAFLAAGVRWDESPVPPDSHGEFGLLANWLADGNRRERVQQWLATSPEVSAVVEGLTAGVAEVGELEDPEGYVRRALFEQLNQAAANPELTGDGLAERVAEAAVLPMYGMPSRSRLLYHRLQQSGAHTIDRDLDLAVTEFAPASQRTKDKRVHQAIGFTAPLMYRGGRWVPSGADPLPEQRWMRRCESCHFTRTADDRPDDSFCPDCGRAMDEPHPFRVYEFAVPLAFRTTLGPGEDAKEEDDLLTVGAATVAESDPSPCNAVPDTNSGLGYSPSGRVYRVNDRRGLLFTGQLGTTLRGNQRLEHQWVDERFRSAGGIAFTPTGPVQSIAIAAPKTTDVLRIRPSVVPQGLTLDPLASAGAVKAAFYSAAFVLRSVAAERLDTNPEEFDISNVRQIELANGVKAGEIVLNDHLANGAGFVRWLGDNWREILESMVGTPPAGTFVSQLISETHRRECDSSGYDCLRQYRNMSYHGLLDWRLGMSLLKCLHSPGYRAGLDGTFASADLEGWMQLAVQRRDSFCESFGCTAQDFGPLPGFIVGSKQVIVVHPLWNTYRPDGLLAAACSTASASAEPIRFADTFNLLRRESRVYQSLGD
jgi:hypothetical protein